MASAFSSSANALAAQAMNNTNKRRAGAGRPGGTIYSVTRRTIVQAQRSIRGTNDGEVQRDMANHRTARLLTRMIRDTLASVAVVVATVSASPVIDADAAMTPTRGWSDGSDSSVSHNGNGKFNRNNFSVNSPSFPRGNQHIFNQNIGGQNPSQAALCKRKFRHCKIVQRLAVDR